MKIFLGRNPGLDLRGVNFFGKSILEVGFGDGRDLVLFSNLGFNVFGVEVDEQVVKHTQRKLAESAVKTELRVGYNDETGFESNSLDYVYSAAALMYLRNELSSIHGTLSHIFDIVRPGGKLFATFTRSDSHIVEGSQRLDRNRIIVKDPFFRQREGQLYWLHSSKEEVERDVLGAGFSNCKVYDYNVDWFGTRETAFICVAAKALD